MYAEVCVCENVYFCEYIVFQVVKILALDKDLI